MIRLDGVSKFYGDKAALSDVSVAVEPGQVLGYLGPNGAGKTTTVKILTAVLKPDRGSVQVCGFDALKNPVSVKRRVGYVPEVAALYESMTPVEYGRFVGRLHKLPPDVLERRLDTFLEIFGLGGDRHGVMATFSKGMKQKVLILTALLHNPPLVILDEPLNGLDANAALLLKDIIARLADGGRTVFYCSHLLDVVEKVCHRVVILNEGRVLADGAVDAVRAQSKSGSIEAAFSELTSTTDWSGLAADFVAALGAVEDGEAGSARGDGAP
jgi:ABC-2 type transport system ATP-binding protein